jgi:hypothetical protein
LAKNPLEEKGLKVLKIPILVDQFQMIKQCVQQRDGRAEWGVSEGRALYSMPPWLVEFLHTSGPGIRKTNPPRQPRMKGTFDMPFRFD